MQWIHLSEGGFCAECQMMKLRGYIQSVGSRKGIRFLMQCGRRYHILACCIGDCADMAGRLPAEHLDMPVGFAWTVCGRTLLSYQKIEIIYHKIEHEDSKDPGGRSPGFLSSVGKIFQRMTKSVTGRSYTRVRSDPRLRASLEEVDNDIESIRSVVKMNSV